METNEKKVTKSASITTEEFFRIGNRGNCSNPGKHSPRLNRKNCFYIVSVVLIEGDNVLLVSEAKENCYEAWCLPGGKVRQYESIIDAFHRELEEESFIKGEPDHLISINAAINMGRWIRFNFVGHRTGGRLKTLQDKDRHSLEAKWQPISDVFDGKIEMRHKDSMQLLKDALGWFSIKANLNISGMTVPFSIKHQVYFQRFFIIKTDWKDRLQALLLKANGEFPMIDIDSLNLIAEIEKYKKEKGINIQFLGLISIEHFIEKPGDTDGICFNTVCEYVDDDSFPIDSSECYFKECPQELLECLKKVHDCETYIKYYAH